MDTLIRKATHLHASSYSTDTETTIEDHGTYLRVSVRLLPGLRFWSAPSATVMRKWVDEFLSVDRMGRKRLGPRVERDVHPGWAYVYYLTDVAE